MITAATADNGEEATAKQLCVLLPAVPCAPLGCPGSHAACCCQVHTLGVLFAEGATK